MGTFVVVFFAKTDLTQFDIEKDLFRNGFVHSSEHHLIHRSSGNVSPTPFQPSPTPRHHVVNI